MTTTPVSQQAQAQPLQFQPFTAALDVSFWTTLAAAKLDLYKLDNSARHIQAHFAPSTHPSLPAQLCLGNYSFEGFSATPPQLQAGSYFGTLHNANTNEEFRKVDAAGLLQALREEMWNEVKTYIAQEEKKEAEQTSSTATTAASSSSLTTSSSATPPPSLTHILSRFLLLTYADLKSHRYTYWFCYPAWQIDGLAFHLLPPTAATTSAVHSSSPSSVSTKVVSLFGEEGSKQLLQQYNTFVQQHPIEAGSTSAVHAANGNSNSNNSVGENFFVVEHRSDSNTLLVHSIDRYGSLLRSSASSPSSHIYLAVIDPCPLDTHPGWPGRNLLTYAWLRWGHLLEQQQQKGQIKLLAFRDPDAARSLAMHSSGDATAAAQPPQINVSKLNSVVFTVQIAAAPGLDRATSLSTVAGPKVVGWEKNAATGKSTPRLVDLGAMMDPLRLAESSVNLNIKLMRWRALPSLDLPLLQRTRCLLLGAGTLGCNVARCLLGWGVNHITFVDNGKVSYSNPVRQSLFKYEDCLNGGRSKTEAAAESLKQIYPHVKSIGVNLTIPMPGHAASSPQQVEEALSALAHLTELVQQADVVFLLTDSRESRWVPTVLCARYNKMCINTALGFDTYVVMRHGDNYHAKGEGGNATSASAIPAAAAASSAASSAAASSSSAAAVASSSSPPGLGCYFCSDVVAPTDSLTDRTLDQQCTVTRPGLAFVSSAYAVELCVALLHHPRRQHAEADTDSSSAHSATSGDSGFGLLPHTMRGFLARFHTTLVRGSAFSHCTACSSSILDRFVAQGDQFILEAMNGPPSFLEDISGLTQLKAHTEELMKQMEMTDEDEEEEGGGEDREDADDF